MGSAWISYFLWLRPYLEDGAAQAAAQQAAEQAAAWRASRDQAPGEAGLESAAGLLDDEDEDDQDAGYGQIMVSMTRPPRRDKHPH